ncbi:MAG: cation diffusion facilitator family transporter [Bacteroidales bacterium]|jgi:cation diffusion facilitator family transporter|nr:cation diffusion facilitator family transporter [Bacteroidales bacterium]MDD3300136.1 cation diffusion facilitator family transporter [Bacteroidales bacterium]MDD3844053.1 cation diffusion facilitator family transporter [Bacteroidales bacterium]MDD4617989.1 cation diffusion facilitator family transporter [Bacteroidales bacterium]
MEQRSKIAKKVTFYGFIVNVALSGAKLIAGILGQSSAMIADAVHSISDFATDIVVIAFVNISGKESDESHKYGHGKFETFATLIISLVLIGVAAGILLNGVKNIMASLRGNLLPQPGIIAFWAALVSVIVKELLYRYTIKEGKKIKSNALIANGWHHRSDAFSSLGTALGIAGAIFLGENWRVLDPIAGVIVSLFIFKVAYDLAMPSIKELLDASLPADVVEQIEDILTNHPEIQLYHHLRTRKIGSVYAIDVHIKLDKTITFVRSHDIATEIEIELRNHFGKETQIIIHTEPY